MVRGVGDDEFRREPMPMSAPVTPPATATRPQARDLWLLAGAGAATAGGLAGAIAARDATGSMAALWLVHGVGLTMFLAARRPQFSRAVVRVAMAVAIALPALATAQSVLAPDPADGSPHDGGVIVTRAAAERVLAGANPYDQDYTGILPDDWLMISMDGSADGAIANPIGERYPYLPGAFLVMTPTNALGGDDGAVGDPRWVMLLTYAGAMIAIGTWPAAANWARVAALASVTGPLTITHMATGTNDAWAVALLVLAARALPSRAVVSGVLAALAVAAKIFVLPGLVLWAAWTWRRKGWAELLRYWSAPVTLLVTTLPFLAWSTTDFLHDTAWFWLGRGDDGMPVSGLGLPAIAPGIADGPALAVATIASATAGVVAAWWLLERADAPAALPPAVGLVVIGILMTARTFQGNYLVVIAGLLCTVPLIIGSGPQTRDRASSDALVTAPG